MKNRLSAQAQSCEVSKSSLTHSYPGTKVIREKYPAMIYLACCTEAGIVNGGLGGGMGGGVGMCGGMCGGRRRRRWFEQGIRGG